MLGVSAWGQDVYYTLDTSFEANKTNNNSYGETGTVTVNDIVWYCEGNGQILPWRLGGKNINGVDRSVYSNTGMNSPITQVDLTVGSATISVNSLKLTIASNADFSTILDEVTANFTASSTLSFTPSLGNEWPVNAYYKFTFNVKNTTNSNKYVEFSKADFIYSSNKQAPNLKWMKDSEDVTNTTITHTMGDSFAAPILSKATGFNGIITYTSSDEQVATINSSGVINIVGSGNTIIMASTSGNDNWSGGSAKYTLNVQKREPNLVWSVTTLTIDMGDTFTQPTLSSASGFNGSISYESSKENVAIVNSDGQISIVGIGTTTIKAKFDGNETWKAQTVSYELTVNRVAAFNEVFYESFNLCEGTGGNDGRWSGSIANAALNPDNNDNCWTFVKGGGGNQCAKFGTGSEAGSAKFTLDLEAGEYQLNFNAGSFGNDNTTLNIEPTGCTISTNNFELSNSQFQSYSVNLNVATTSTISIKFSGSKRFFLDEVVLNITKVSIPMNADGIRTYASVYGLDFSQVEGLTAYYATGYDKTNLSLTMTAVNSTAPGDGMMLKGEAGEKYLVPIITEGSTSTTNLLVGLTQVTNVSKIQTIDNVEYTTLILANKESNGINWYVLAEDSYNLKANSAYLRLPSSALPTTPPANLSMDFGGGSNGINTTTATKVDAKWYTLDGRLLQSKPSTKGIYVNNGHKVVIK